jgi:hypothetical protein
LPTGGSGGEWQTLVTAEGITNGTSDDKAFASTLKLPLAGYRSRSDGSLSSQGSGGYYWSSSVTGINGYHLRFNSTSVDPAYTNSRAYGFTVRCVKDSNSPLVLIGNRTGIGSTTPYAQLGVNGLVAASSFNADNPSLTSTFVGLVNIVGNLTAGYASTTQIGSTGSAYFATAGGNVGIGTSTPASLLTLSKTNSGATYTDKSSSALVLDNPTGTQTMLGFSYGNTVKANIRVDNGGGIVLNSFNHTYYLNNDVDSALATLNIPSSGINITGGNVGIGTTTPRGKLDVNGSVVFEGLGTSYATTTALGGGALLAGACASVTTTTGVSGLSSTTAMVTTPQSDPGDGFFWNSIVMSATSIKTRVCASVAGTPTSSLYNIKIIN